MRIKRNGFTLIELLAVIVVLGLLVMMAVPNVISLFDEKKEILYDTTITEIERLASVYMTENPDLYTDIDINNYVNITTGALCVARLVNCPIKDPRDDSEIVGYVRVTEENGNYVYKFVRGSEPQTDGESTETDVIS